MATFQASATSPTCAYNESAQMDDAAFDAILAAARKRFGQAPVIGADGQPEKDAGGFPVVRDMTNEETVKRMLGSFLLGWASNARDDARDAALAAINVQAPGWTVTA